MESDLESLKERIRDLETCIENGVVAAAQKETSSIMDKNLEAPSESGEVIELTEAEYEDYKQLNTDWNKIIGQQRNLVRGILRGTRLSYDKSKGLCILFTDSFSEKMMNEQNRMDDLKQWLQQTYGKVFTISTKYLDSSQAQPHIVRGNHIPGIEMEIGIEE